MKTKEYNDLTAAVKEVTKTHVNMQADAARSVTSATKGAHSVNKLYKSGNKSILVKVGLALIVFPEPVVSDMLGTTLLAAGAVQEGIKRQSIYLDDLPKAFKSVMRDVKSAKELL